MSAPVWAAGGGWRLRQVRRKAGDIATVSEESIRKWFGQYQDYRTSVLNSLHRQLVFAKRSGLGEGELVDALRRGGIGKADAEELVDGYLPTKESSTRSMENRLDQHLAKLDDRPSEQERVKREFAARIGLIEKLYGEYRPPVIE